MKNLFILLIIILTISSCKKDDFGQYQTVQENTYNPPKDSTTYTNGGTLPTNTATNSLVGTQWVLIKYVSAFATEYPNDTLNFVSTNTYTVNDGAIRNYQLSTLPLSTNYDLSLYYFFPFGGSHYSGEVGSYFVDDGEINNIEFMDIQNFSSTIRAWFQKI